MRALSCLLVIVLGVSFAACSAQREAGEVAAVAPAALPAPGSLHPRMTSDGSGRYAGDRYQQDLPSQGVAEEGPFLDYFPQASGTGLADCAYALFYLPADDTASGKLSISFDWWVQPDFGKMHVAIANRARDAWEWEALSSAAYELTRDPDDDYVDAAGGILLALLAQPGAGPTSLALLNVETQSGGGWQNRELASFSGAANYEAASLEDVAMVQGRPAILYVAAPEDAPRKLHLLTSSTAEGLGSADWTDFDLGVMPADGQLYFCLAEMNGNYGIAWAFSTNEGAGELHYMQCQTPESGMPSSGFSQTVVVSNANGQIAWPKLTEVSGAVEIAFFNGAEGSMKPWFAASNAAGETFINTKVSDMFTPSGLLIDDAMPHIRVIADNPMIAILADEGENQGLFAFWGNEPVPNETADWTAVRLGDAVDTRLVCDAGLNGSPVFAAGSLYSFPQSFTVFHYNGGDPVSDTGWDRTVLDNIGISFSSQVQMFSLGSGIGIMAGDSYGVSTPRPPFLNESGRPLQLYQGGALVNDAAQWAGQVVQHDSSGTILDNARFVDLGAGQAAYASLQLVELDDSATGALTTLRWGVLAP